MRHVAAKSGQSKSSIRKKINPTNTPWGTVVRRSLRSVGVSLTATWLLASGLFGQSTVLSPPKAHDPNRPEALTLVVSPGGFPRSTITVEAGYYLIDIINRTGGKQLSLQIDRVTGAGQPAALAKGEASTKRSHFQSLQNLTPGTYRLSVTNIPSWLCTIEAK